MPETRTLPGTPEQLLADLFAIFPQYRSDYAGPIHDETPTFHSVLIGFSSFPLASSSESQLRDFGALVSAAIAAGGTLGNAFETCLLEHLHQIRAERALRPYLSTMAREKTKA
jgi:hypothetical protein